MKATEKPIHFMERGCIYKHPRRVWALCDPCIDGYMYDGEIPVGFTEDPNKVTCEACKKWTDGMGDKWEDEEADIEMRAIIAEAKAYVKMSEEENEDKR